MERFCQACGAKVSETAKFCKKCGTRLERIEEKTFCEECGAELAPDSDFCEECGTRRASASATVRDVWETPAADAWGDTLGGLTAFEEEERFSSFEYEKRPDGSVVITGLKDKYAVNIAIPDGVTVIAEEAFARTKIISVKLPEGLTTIDRRAFFNCDNLTSINLPASLMMICAEAFAECERLELTIPESVSIVEEGVLRETKLEIQRRKEEELARAEEERRRAEELARQRAREEEKRKKEAGERMRREEYKRAHKQDWAQGLEDSALGAPSYLSGIYNDPLAVEWLTEKSSANYYAALCLAKCYIHGYGTPVNRNKAKEILAKLSCSSNALPRVKKEAAWIAEAYGL